MSYVIEFTTDIRYTKDSENFTADALSRVIIYNVEHFCEGIDYGKIAATQRDDAAIHAYLSKLDTMSSFKPEQIRVPEKFTCCFGVILLQV